MPAWVPSDAALARATAQRTLNAAGTLHLYKDSLTPSGTTNKAAYLAAEANYDDYAPITVATWYAPIVGGAGTYLLTMPQQQFSQGASDPSTTNQIRGFFYLSAAGNLLYAGRFSSDVPVDVAHAGVPVELIDVFATGFSG